jgi:hypothetical protein
MQKEIISRRVLVRKRDSNPAQKHCAFLFYGSGIKLLNFFVTIFLDLGFDRHIEKNDVIDKLLDMNSPKEIKVIKMCNVYTLFQIGELRFRPGDIDRIS